MILAMAGLAEEAELFVFHFSTVVLLIVAGLLTLAWWKQSKIVATVACFLLLVLGLLNQPWSAMSPPISTDPDEKYWLFWFRITSTFWALLVIGAAYIAMLIRRRKFKRVEMTSSE